VSRRLKVLASSVATMIVMAAVVALVGIYWTSAIGVLCVVGGGLIMVWINYALLTRVEESEARLRGIVDTAMHAAAIPDADRSALADPRVVARRILAIVESAESLQSGARLEAAHLVLGRPVGGGEMQDGNRGRGRIVLQPPAHLEAVEVGKVHVEDDQVGTAGGAFQRLGTARRLDDGEACALQDDADERAHVAHVVDDEDRGLGRARQAGHGIAGPGGQGPITYTMPEDAVEGKRVR